MTGKMFKTCAIVFMFILSSAYAHQDAKAAVSYRTIAVTGDIVPGTSGEVNFDKLGFYSMNNSGQFAFVSSVSGKDVNETNSEGIWLEDSGSIRLVARAGDQTPNTESGVVFSNFSHAIINNAGKVAFTTFLSGPGVDATNDRSFWTNRFGPIGLVAREGDSAPGLPDGVVFSQLLSFPLLNNNGHIAFESKLTGNGVNNINDEGIWSEASGSLALVVREGDHPPGSTFGTRHIGFLNLSFNDLGQTAFIGYIDGGDRGGGIWIEDNGTLYFSLRNGTQAPGMPDGVVVAVIKSVLNSQGNIAFVAGLRGPGVDRTNNLSVWSDGSGHLTMIAREGDHAPGTSLDTFFSDITQGNLVTNSEGRVAFTSILRGTNIDATNHTGIWADGRGYLELIARGGNHAPGTPDGVVFDAFNRLPLINGRGQIAFTTSLRGTGVTEQNDHGIWVTNPNGALELIAREGDLFDVNNDPLIEDLKTIKTVFSAGGSGGESGMPRHFSDSGQLAFYLEFTDGSNGLFVATIPEPATLMLFAAGLGIIYRRGR